MWKSFLLLILLGIGVWWAPRIEAHWGLHELQELKRYLPTEGVGDPTSGGQMLGKVPPSAPARLGIIGTLMLGLLIGGAIILWLQEKRIQANQGKTRETIPLVPPLKIPFKKENPDEAPGH